MHVLFGKENKENLRVQLGNKWLKAMQLPETQTEHTDIKAESDHTNLSHADQMDLIRPINQAALPIIEQCPAETTKRVTHMRFKMDHLDKNPHKQFTARWPNRHKSLLHFQLCDRSC